MYLDKEGVILKISAGKKVLHLGCVGYTDLPSEQRIRFFENTLHHKLSKVANVTGIDNSEEVISDPATKGMFGNVLLGNVERLKNINLQLKFDIVIAGDIIEHISRPGDMLEGIRDLLTKEGVLIVTTPNAFGLLGFLRNLVGRFHEGEEHVMSFNALNLQTLLRRHGFAIQQVNTCHQPQAKKNPFFHLGKAFFTAMPALGGTLFVVARPIQPKPMTIED